LDRASILLHHLYYSITYSRNYTNLNLRDDRSAKIRNGGMER
jgi:hypothetical protein